MEALLDVDWTAYKQDSLSINDWLQDASTDSIKDWPKNISASDEIDNAFNEQTSLQESKFESLKTRFLVDLDLLRSIHGIFTTALSQTKSSGRLPYVITQFALAGIRMTHLPPVLYDLSENELAILQSASQNLKYVLDSFDEAVLNGVLEQKTITAQGYRSNSSFIHLKLAALVDLGSWKDDRSSLYSDKSNDLEAYADPESKIAAGYVKLRLDIKQELHLWEQLRELNTALDQLDRLATDSSSYKTSNLRENIDTKTTIEAAWEAHEFWQQMTSFFDSLVNSVQHCKTEHTMQIDLSTLASDRDNLEVHFSRCPKELNKIWHPGTMKHSILKYIKQDSYDCILKLMIFSQSQGKPMENLCDHLKESAKRNRQVSLALAGKSIKKIIGKSYDSKKIRQSSFVDLATVFKSRIIPGSDISETIANTRRLQCLLAQSLLFLHPGSWMPVALDLTSIHFALQQTVFNLRNPFLLCALSRILDHDISSDSQKFDASEAAIFMIDFGLLILQIERRQQLEFTEDEETEQYGHETALQRYLAEFEGSLDQRIEQIIRDCLDFESCLEDNLYYRLPIKIRTRFFVLRRILEPLNESLATRFPDVAAEILPLESEKNRDDKELSSTTAEDTSKRKHELTKSPDKRITMHHASTNDNSTRPDEKLLSKRPKIGDGSSNDSQDGNSDKTRRVLRSTRNNRWS